MYVTNQQIAKSIFFNFFYKYIYTFINLYHNYNVVNSENINKDYNKGCIYISRHSTHNYELLGGLFTLYKYSKKPVRGIGHYLIYILCPYYISLGVVIGTNGNVDNLLKHNEDVYILPGGAEEMTYGGKNALTCYWTTMSNRYRMGFAKLAIKHNVPIIPVASLEVKDIVWAPFIDLARLLYITEIYNWILFICFEYKKLYRILFYIKIFMSCLFGSILVIPKPKKINLRIGNHIYIQENESVFDFTKRCETELNNLVKTEIDW